METTVARQYQVTDNPDGSKTLVFKSDKFGAHKKGDSVRYKQGSVTGCVVAPIILFVSLIFGGLIGSGSSSGSGFVFGGIIFIFLFLLWMKRKPKKIIEKQVVLTEKGLIYNHGNGKLNISDIEAIGIEDESSSTVDGYMQSSIVYARVFGNKVNITGYITKSLAQSLEKEITNFYSGQFE